MSVTRTSLFDHVSLGDAPGHPFEKPPTPSNNLFSSSRAVLMLSCSVTLLVLGLVSFAYCQTPTDLNFAQDWENQKWTHLDCMVQDVGIAYRGNCHMDVSVQMTKYTSFKECMGPRESEGNAESVRMQWDGSAAGRCATQGDRDYLLDTGHEVRPGENGEELEKDARGRLRRLQFSAPVISNLPNRMECHNSYLLWSTMSVPGGIGRRCSYEFGSSAPSITGNWKTISRMKRHLHDALATNSNVSCWILADDDCVVAFHDEQVLINQKADENLLIQRGGLVCTALGLCCAVLAAYWYSVDLGFWGEKPMPWYHQALPTEEPALLSARVRTLLDMARLGEETPPASGCSTVRGEGGTVQVVGPGGICKSIPRNVATDFLASQ